MVNYVRPSERNVAMVFQSYALYPHMTVRENITFPLTTSHGRHFDRATVAKRVAEAAQLVDLTDKLERLPSQLSGGQRQRVALARSIVRHPVAFLMDEPLSNLDALLRHEMRQSLIDLHRRVGRTTLYVTHDQFEAMTMANRIVVMDHGRIQQAGTPREVFERPANRFVAGFVGLPSMNMLRGPHRGWPLHQPSRRHMSNCLLPSLSPQKERASCLASGRLILPSDSPVPAKRRSQGRFRAWNMAAPMFSSISRSGMPSAFGYAPHRRIP